jgi:hypothetical protein
MASQGQNRDSVVSLKKSLLSLGQPRVARFLFSSNNARGIGIQTNLATGNGVRKLMNPQFPGYSRSFHKIMLLMESFSQRNANPIFSGWQSNWYSKPERGGSQQIKRIILTGESDHTLPVTEHPLKGFRRVWIGRTNHLESPDQSLPTGSYQFRLRM